MSAGVTITLLMNLKPEAVEPFCGSLQEMLKDTKNFPGFRNIRVVRHKTEPNQVIFIEEWDSEDAYNKYIAWRTESGAMEALGSALTAPPKLDVWPTLVAT
jgi:quinol monooxygenase YgiN